MIADEPQIYYFLKHLKGSLFLVLNDVIRAQATCSLKGWGTPKKLATATQPQFPPKIACFKKATGFRINRRSLRKIAFD
jgi:hypothetical protein